MVTRALRCVLTATVICVAAPAHAQAEGSSPDSTLQSEASPSDTTQLPKPIFEEWFKAYRESYVYAGGDQDHQMYLLIPSTLKKTARGTVKFWLRIVPGLDVDPNNYDSFRENYVALISKHGGDPAAYTHYLVSMYQDEVDCARQTLRTLQMVDYDDQGRMIRSSTVHEEFEDMVPGSNGDYLVKIICNPTKRVSFRAVLDKQERPH